MQWTICVYLLTIALSQGSKILALFPLASHSHFTLGFRLAKELADKGHEVTFVSVYPAKDQVRNLRYISAKEAMKNINEMKRDLFDLATMSYLGQLSWVTSFGEFCTEEIMKTKNVQQLLHSNETFDLILFEDILNQAMVIFQYKFKCPLVVVAPGSTTIYNNYLFANPSQPAYVPNFLANFGSQMTLWERVQNVYYDVAGELFIHFVAIPNQNAILQRTVPGSPYLEDILYNASFMLLNSHVSLREPVPLQPNIKEIGGYHLVPPKPLPKDIQEFMDNCTEGVVVFSMGSNFRTANFPNSTKEAVLKVLSKVKLKVLWKFETDLPDVPKNVKIMKWLPQQDVLAHPNVAAFITHGGQLGTIEGVYHGVPMLGLPIAWDQVKNIKDAVRHGFALSVQFSEITEKTFGRALNELLNNPKYKENVKTRSRIMRDQPIKQLDEAIFWIEYVIRHKGAPHYRCSALDLNVFQRLLLDVIFIVTAIVSIIFAVIVYVLRIILTRLSKEKVKEE